MRNHNLVTCVPIFLEPVHCTGECFFGIMLPFFPLSSTYTELAPGFMIQAANSGSWTTDDVIGICTTNLEESRGKFATTLVTILSPGWETIDEDVYIWNDQGQAIQWFAQTLRQAWGI